MYNDFALVYDRFQEIDYDSFIRFYQKMLGDNVKTVLDLGCGSGEITLRLAKCGYDVMGVDISDDMLALAQDKAYSSGRDIFFVNGDMTEFVHPSGVDAVVSSLDCINYLTDYNDVVSAFVCVYESLNKGGLFIFDINSEYKLSHILGDNTFVYEDEEAYCVWNCEYSPEERICGFDLNFFVRQGENNMYNRYFEYQEERAYSIDEIKAAICEAGLSLINVYADLSIEAPEDNAERLFFICRKI